ncbi:hypothetical protein KFK09_018314 [Dendrobium nobile]|uniref:non-specific serine/threonine protein kinase n=1 Tax=Dendrobium nobile TaxID=94219 RepID=A0A8T3AU27_DENNO|nr:hypothetical protein KFK09_018314 [Dendrobium nobile]
MSCSSSSGSEEDEGAEAYRKGGYHAVRPGDPFDGGRYIAQRKLGWGNFSTVWLAYDTKYEKFVALKIQKSAAEFAQAAVHEIEVLSAIAKGDLSNSKCVVHLVDNFKHAGPNGQHPCMVFENLGDSLLRLIRYNRYKGIGLNNVKDVCRSILLGLDYLHRELSLIHTDLKPENILLVSTIDPMKDPIRSGSAPILVRPEGNPKVTSVVNSSEKKLKERAKCARARISKRRASMGGFEQGVVVQQERTLEGIDLKCKIVDFGNACWVDKQIASEIQTRQYRAPEVILGAGYFFSADIWSFACIAFELATGDVLFSPKAGQGFTEDEIAISGSRSKDYFDRHGDLKRIRRLKFWPIDKLLVDKYKFSESDAREFFDFLVPLLDFTPEKRPTAAQCLQHPWLNKSGSNTNAETKGVDKLAMGTGKLRL